MSKQRKNLKTVKVLVTSAQGPKTLHNITQFKSFITNRAIGKRMCRGNIVTCNGTESVSIQDIFNAKVVEKPKGRWL
jgi:hypothetical protein